MAEGEYYYYTNHILHEMLFVYIAGTEFIYDDTQYTHVYVYIIRIDKTSNPNIYEKSRLDVT